jgi:hypothetical protein
MDLEIEAVEHCVGLFRADILARATNDIEHRVLMRISSVSLITGTLDNFSLMSAE